MLRVLSTLFSVVVLLIGAMLCYSGVQSYHSFEDGLTRLFTGSSTDTTIWLLTGGVVMLAAGLGGLLFGPRR
ncbi:DUF3185 family protein [Chitinasiproducens palmae]|uniref:DUF3185 family protein n=1 Tax=Chitinasiproducens palmae TaxID=1770053 RepID=A0A1H2PP20_9BURK|nr:DUF3185 family protein [Chitinasiproducens palmae]SDV48472.1 Protein of unknown function [Chitinasiproducens palmae]